MTTWPDVLVAAIAALGPIASVLVAAAIAERRARARAAAARWERGELARQVAELRSHFERWSGLP